MAAISAIARRSTQLCRSSVLRPGNLSNSLASQSNHACFQQSRSFAAPRTSPAMPTYGAAATACLATGRPIEGLGILTFQHISAGIEEILADYVHQGMTRKWILIFLEPALLIAAKDLFVSSL